MPSIDIYHPSELNSNEWLQLQCLARAAYGAELDRSLQEIDELVEWQDPNRFYASHIDPNTEVGRRYNPNQSYTQPKVAVATDGQELVGFAYSAHNVSGATELIRLRKRLSVVKNYLWLREVVVRPDHQRHGVAKQMGQTLLRHAILYQPVSAYVWPEEIPFLQGTMEGLGFQATGEQQVQVFGENSEPIRQVRMQAGSAKAVLSRIA